jgi:hypothetical protein
MIQENGRRQVRAGDSLDDLCRACKTVRRHTVVAADPEGRPLRMICDYCGSQHNYRGGEAREAVSKTPAEPPGWPPAPPSVEREKRLPVPNDPEQNNTAGLELLLRRIIREETGLTPVAIAEKWRGGELILRPGKPGLQEQQINGADLPEDLKMRLQGYITACYGTLTSFNILFSDEDDRFRGSSGND